MTNIGQITKTTRLSNGRFGPQSMKVEDILEKATAEHAIFFGCYSQWYVTSHHDHTLDPGLKKQSLEANEAVSAETERSGRQKINADLEQEVPLVPSIHPSVMAIVLEDRVGDLFTKAHYDFLVTPIKGFLEIVNETEPGSPLRILTLDLLRTMNGSEALVEAQRILG